MRAEEVFSEMRNRNLTTSLRAWSEEWCQRAPNFGATHREKSLPPQVAITLRRRLIEAGHPDLAAKVLLDLLGELEPQPRRTRSRRR